MPEVMQGRFEKAWLRVGGRVRTLFKYGVAAGLASLFTVFQLGDLSPSNRMIMVGEACAIIGGVVGYIAGSDTQEVSK